MRDKRDPTALFNAIEKKNIKMVIALIKAGYDLNSTNIVGNTALALLAKHFSFSLHQIIPCLEAMKDQGHQLNKKTMFEIDRYFLSAITSRNERLIKAFIDAGMDINYVNQKTSYLVTAVKTSSKITKLLIDNGAKLDCKKENLYHRRETKFRPLSPMELATDSESYECVQALAGGPKAENKAVQDELTIGLHYAIKRVDFKLAKTLLEKGAQANSLHLKNAVDNNKPELAELLINHGARHDAKDGFLNQILHL